MPTKILMHGSLFAGVLAEVNISDQGVLSVELLAEPVTKTSFAVINGQEGDDKYVKYALNQLTKHLYEAYKKSCLEDADDAGEIAAPTMPGADA